VLQTKAKAALLQQQQLLLRLALRLAARRPQAASATRVPASGWLQGRRRARSGPKARPPRLGLQLS
jgi:hypothetical protein